MFGPIWGTVWNTTLSFCEGHGSVALAGTCEPRLEPEAVFGIAATPPARATLDDLFACLDWVAPGFEIVQSHMPGWKFQAADTVADGGSLQLKWISRFPESLLMKYRALGSSNLQVSMLCLGTMMFGDQTGIDEARAILKDAEDQGVNYVDTADVYTQGASETMLGELLQGRRQRWVVATKLGNKMSDRPNEGHFSRTWMLREIDESLARLRMDHVDILYMHRDNNGMDLEEPLRTLDAMLRAGKIRYWGLSNFRGWRIAEAVRIAAQIGMPGPVVCQPYYNLLNRMPEVEILPACEHHGIGVTPYSPIARGVLTGKYLPGQPPPDGTRAARGDKRIAQTEFREESLVIAQRLQAHAQARGVTLAQFATAWVLAHRAVSSVIAGPRTLAQWQGYAGALACVIEEQDEALVDSMVAPGHPSTPGFSDPAYPLPPRSTARDVKAA